MQGLDAQNRFSNAQAITATALSTNSIDLDVVGRNLGAGEPMCVLVNADAALEGTTNDETYVISLETDDNAAMSSATTIVSVSTPAALQDDPIGSRYMLFIPPGTVFERYIAVRYTLGGTTPTATFTAYLMPLKAVLALATYPDNIIPK